MKRHCLSLTIILLIVCAGLHGQRITTPHLANTFHLTGDGGWDYLETCPANNWLYVSHGNQVNIVDKTTGDSIGTLQNTTGIHGIAFDMEHKKGFTSNGKINSVTVFDMTDNKVMAQIPVGQNPDAIMYEPFTKKIITCNGRSNNLGFIDPATNQLTDSIALTGKPETAVTDAQGLLYVNIEDKNEITVVDLKTMKVLHHWSMQPGEGPTGLAFDPVTKRLFAGCDLQLIVLDAITGKVLQNLPIGEGCDGVAFDPALKNIYTSNGEGTMSVFHEDNAGKVLFVNNVPTKKGARTINLDKATHLLYLPTAEFEPLQPGQTGRPKIKPGTFQVMVFAN